MKYSKLFLFLVFTCLTQLSFAQKKLDIWVNGACGMCKERIETASMQIMGVEKAVWDVNTKILSLKINKDFYEDDLHTHIASVGHDTRKALAADDVYNDLTGCCLYRSDNPEEHSDDDGHGHATENLTGVSQFLNDGHDIHGIILENNKQGQMVSIIGATVYWEGKQTGTSSDVDGYFHLDRIKSTNNLIVSYVGYAPDTINMANQNAVEIILKNNFVLDEINISYKKKTTNISFINTMKVQQINQKELLKAACCSLSESFETTPTVDVSFTDAITGTRKIELLGLAGPYVQVMRENMPYIRGLAAVYGFTYTPGPWIESMQLNMGAASVVNGPEAMTGQINLEIKKPNESERLYINGYVNQFQRLEFNVNGSEKINKKWSTAYLAHVSNQDFQQDQQGDGFIDSPVSKQFIAMNRWKYSNGKGLESQVGIKGTYLNKVSGELFDSKGDNSSKWLADVNTQRIEGWFKMGKVFRNNPNSSLGFQFNTSHHIQDANFGSRIYDGKQTSFYSNLIFQTLLGESDKHKLRTGISAQYDIFDENVDVMNYQRKEAITGVFGEYHWNASDKFDVIAGLRADYNNIYGAFITPRLHVKYAPNETTALRFVAGKGQRTATIFSENIGIFASNRAINFSGTDPSKPYGLGQEIAWNTGVNFTKEIIINKRSFVFSTDYYFTSFVNQIVIDYDQSPQEVNIYNLEGESFSHSFQAQTDYELIDGLDIRLAYRYNDVQTDFLSGRLFKPLISKHRAFVNVGWELGKGWMVDGTLNFQGSKRIPNTLTNPEAFRFDENSPSFYTVNGQLSKSFKKGIEFYLGVENLLNYIQNDVIISAEDTSSPYFDSSLVWGPIMGRNVYLGFRYKVF